VSGKRFHVNDTELFIDENGKKLTWLDMQLGIIKIPLETFKAMKKYFIDNCKKNSQCSDKIDSWDRNISVLESKATGGK
jgi:hypothetical protein